MALIFCSRWLRSQEPRASPEAWCEGGNIAQQSFRVAQVVGSGVLVEVIGHELAVNPGNDVLVLSRKGMSRTGMPAPGTGTQRTDQ